jgi:Putative Flp pilus-assembly TadE/G-like
MRTPSSRTPRPSRAQLLSRRPKPAPRSNFLRVAASSAWRGLNAPEPLERGQALILITITFLALLAFVGLVTDVGSLYNAYGQLKRGVDGAVLASAVQFRETGDVNKLSDIARETLALNGINNVSATVLICDNDGDLKNDDPDTLPALPAGVDPVQFKADFAKNCTPTGDKVSRKFVWVFAQQLSPVYFLQLFGVQSVPLVTYSLSEAATLDIVLVLDTSESMGIQPCDNPSDSDGDDPNQFNCVAGSDVLNQQYNSSTTSCNEIPGCDAGNYAKFCNDELATPSDPDPDGNGRNACYPFYLVKNAAASFINKINFPYDHVAIVTFDGNRFDCEDGAATGYDGNPCPPYANNVDAATFYNPPSARLNLPLTDDKQAALDLVSLNPADNPVPVYYEDESYKGDSRFDLNQDQLPDVVVDYNDLSLFCTSDPGPAQYSTDWTGAVPSPFDPVTNPLPFDDNDVARAVLRYCGASNVGGGMRVAGEALKEQNGGRTSGVGIIVFLADGFTNLSDLPPIVDGSYTNGFCQGPNTATGPNPDGWFMVRPLCSDRRILTRYCADDNPTDCPPNYGSTTVVYDDPLVLPNFYNVEDYARDAADSAALQVTKGSGSAYNPDEPQGGNAVIYTIALGSAITFASDNVDDDNGSTLTAGVAMLRYFAAVGYDGDRVTDPCNGQTVTTQCGNYYYSPDAAGLARIFDAIAEKVFFRISQ